MSDFIPSISAGRRVDSIRRTIRAGHRAACRKGFSFAEVMFAVVILGIGFILVAAIFPVAIEQTQATSEEGSAAGVARDVANTISSLPSTWANPAYSATQPPALPPAVPPATLNMAWSVQSFQLFPPTVKNYVQGLSGTIVPSSTVPALWTTLVSSATIQSWYSVPVPPPAVIAPFVGPQWDAMHGNMISTADPRYATVVLYRRENGSNSVQLIVIAGASRQVSAFDPAVDMRSGAYTTGVSISTTRAGYPGTAASAPSPTVIYPDTVTLSAPVGQEGYWTGLFNQLSYPNYKLQGKPAGRAYRIGRAIGTTSSTYEMEPGGNMTITPGSSGVWGTSGGVSDLPLTTPEPGPVVTPPMFHATVAYAHLQADPSAPGGRIHLFAGPNVNNNSDNLPPAMASPGAFVIIADDFPFDPSNLTDSTGTGIGYAVPNNIYATLQNYPSAGLTGTVPLYTVGSLNGRVFRLGKAVDEDFSEGFILPPGVFDLDPQYGMRPAQGPLTFSPDTYPNPALVGINPAMGPVLGGGGGALGNAGVRAKVFIVGLGRDNRSASNDTGTQTYSKNSQDIGIFSTYFLAN